jgi:Formaldehyde-activating enzyme (Fae)
MGTVQAAIAHGVLDSVRAGVIPKDKVNDLGIIYWAGIMSAGITAQTRLWLLISGSSSEINRINALGGRQMTSFHRGPKYLKL